MLFLISGYCLYCYLGVCVGVALFDQDKTLLDLIVLLILSLLWPVTLLGMSIYKFTRFVNKL